MRVIPYGRQNISSEDVAAVTEVLQSDWLTQGPQVPAFERALADYCGAAQAVAVANATAALHLACLALDVGPGDRVWTSPNTFVASANCARYCGAEVDFVDIDPRTYNMSVAVLAAKLAQAKQTGTLPKVVIPVHFAGQSCDMVEIAMLAEQYDFRVIEDASHAVGGSYRDAKVGGCHFSEMTVFSFHPVKIMTTAEGGVITTNSPALAQRLERLRSHGITRDAALMEGENEGGWYYQQLELGFNYRMTDIQAALGRSQLARLDEFVARRRMLAARYDELLQDRALITPWQDPYARSAYHLYPVQIDSAGGGSTRREVFDRLRAAGVLANVHYIPVHLQPYYRRLGFAPGDCPVAELYYACCLSLPLYFGLQQDEQDFVVATLHEALR